MKADLFLDTEGLDALIQADKPFFLHRRPGSDDPVLALFDPASIQTVASLEALNGRQGYLMVPFDQEGPHPLLLLTNPVLHRGLTAINSALNVVSAPPPTNSPQNRKRPVQHMEESCSTERERNQYLEGFEACMDAIHEGSCQKIVLSRQVVRAKPPAFSSGILFAKACRAYPNAFVYLCHTPQTGTWLGSTPESLLENLGDRWMTVALAGTRNVAHQDENPWDAKNRDEQRLVSLHVEGILNAYADRIDRSGPSESLAGHLAHLKTTYHFDMKEAQHDRLGSLLSDLHPTPATCGFPIKKARHVLKRCERHDRSYYAGIVGPYQVEHQTALYVNLRCLNVLEEDLVMYAGGGLLAGSTFESEWTETSLKLETLLSLID